MRSRSASLRSSAEKIKKRLPWCEKPAKTVNKTIFKSRTECNNLLVAIIELALSESCVVPTCDEGSHPRHLEQVGHLRQEEKNGFGLKRGCDLGLRCVSSSTPFVFLEKGNIRRFTCPIIPPLRYRKLHQLGYESQRIRAFFDAALEKECHGCARGGAVRRAV